MANVAVHANVKMVLNFILMGVEKRRQQDKKSLTVAGCNETPYAADDPIYLPADVAP